MAAKTAKLGMSPEEINQFMTNVRVGFQITLTPPEKLALAQAAEREGMSITGFIREAALAAAGFKR